jgi:hypothetical protein
MLMQVLPELLRRSIEEKGGSVTGVILGLMFSGGLFAYSLYNTIQDYILCTQPVQAVCVDLERRRSKGGAAYLPVWEYEYHGQLIRVRSNFSSNVGVLQVGSPKTLYVDPNDPYKFRTKVSGWILFDVIAGFFVVMILAIILL